jgi:cytochrome c556
MQLDPGQFRLPDQAGRMFQQWVLGKLRENSMAIRGFNLALAASVCVLAIAAGVSLSASAPNNTTGLTGIDRADDVIMARQMLMEGMEDEMSVVEVAAENDKDLKLPDLQARAYNMQRLLAAFAHLFPPQTRPPTDGSPSTTSASPAVWENFDDFYGRVTDAAMTAFDLGQSDTADKFRAQVKKLRVACDSCHAVYMKVEAPTPP